MEELTIEQKIEAIKQDTTQKFKVTPWELVYHFGHQRRSWYICEQINTFLADNELELDGDLYHAWFYAELTLQHKKVATTKVTTDPIKRVSSLAAANHKPVFVSRNDELSHAITIMQQKDYSQLPVVSGKGDRSLCGYISWKTIGLALWHGKQGDKVSDFMSEDVIAIPNQTPLLDAIGIISQNEFMLVLNNDKTFAGIITPSDIAGEFFSITQAEAFLLLEQIELQVRILLDRAEFLLEDLKKVCLEEEREVNCIDDLTFGEYQRLIEDPQNWEKIGIKNDHSDFIKCIDNIRNIRNDVMHFEPDGIGRDKMQELREMARYLTEILAVTK